MTGDPVTSQGDADQLAAIHDTLHHGGRTAATVETTHRTAGQPSGGAVRSFLEAPRVDAELLMYCVLISGVLHALADQIGDWAIALGSAGIPASVTSALTSAAGTVHHQARTALLAGAALEHDLAHACAVAARGLAFTGHDAA